MKGEVDEEGVIRKAVCYGRINLQLKVWYRYGDIQQYYPNWKIYKPSLFYNGKRWREDAPHYLNKAKKAKNVLNNQKKPPKAPTSQNTTTNEGYSQSFINPPNKNNKYYDYKNLMMKVDFLLDDNRLCRSSNKRLSNVGQSALPETHSRKALVMGGRGSNRLFSSKSNNSLGHSTHTHTHTHTH